MRNRLLAAGTTLALATFGFSGVALAGEPTTVEVPVPGPTQTVTVPVPGPTETVTTPAETNTETVTVTTPAPKPKSHSGGGSSNSGSSSTLGASSKGTTAVSSTPVATTPVETSVDTSSPVGGVQAGAGGMAPDTGSPEFLAIMLGLLAFGGTTAAVTLRRRADEH
jgi:hypothetical protein